MFVAFVLRLFARQLRPTTWLTIKQEARSFKQACEQASELGCCFPVSVRLFVPLQLPFVFCPFGRGSSVCSFDSFVFRPAGAVRSSVFLSLLRQCSFRSFHCSLPSLSGRGSRKLRAGQGQQKAQGRQIIIMGSDGFSPRVSQFAMGLRPEQ